MNRLGLIAVLLFLGCEDSSESIHREYLVDSTSLKYGGTIGEDIENLCLAGVTDAFFVDSNSIVVIEYVRGLVSTVDLNSMTVSQIGRQGPGPDEYTRPIHGCLLGCNMVAISDVRGQILFYRDTTFISSITETGVFYPLNIKAFADSCLVGRIMELKSDDEGLIAVTKVVVFEDEHIKSIWSDGGKIIDFSSANDFLGMAFLNASFCEGPNKTVFVAQRTPDTYLVTQYNLNGEEVGRIEQEVALVEKEKASKEEEVIVMESLSRIAELEGVPICWEPEPYWDQIIEIGIGPDRNLWIRKGTTNSLAYDVYSTQGEYQHTLIFDERDHTKFWVTHINSFGIVAYDLHPDRSDIVHLIRYDSNEAQSNI
ncbi:hypothetical protein GF402_12060 [Candidatus Fermentibacteria bacterium]|nr:hypothetical protein [Candidatus Fermentibacteria bacterium]